MPSSEDFDMVVDKYGGLEYNSPETQRLREEGDDLFVHVHNSGDSDRPSVKHGQKLMAGVFLAIPVLAAVFVFLMMRCNKRQEASKRNRRQAKKDNEITKLQTKLEAKPWKSGTDNRTSTMTTRTVSIGAESTLDDNSSYGMGDSGSDSYPGFMGMGVDGVAGLPPPVPGKCSFGHGKDGSVCILCNEVFEDEQTFVESNNPQCAHIFHKTCIDKWLGIQNTCPICNQPYVLQTV
ncbi:E3 ubiquitin-protein ligase [Seminavis robusta]|uniref:E3 ubiquitin-protein ligase n=1 Tax=Seminavis robusta TaxID=568900 RepID=A0A9N8EKT1_9STRA|nr:E3 ubiquitin-protein ligase [Seminavis robusta]|eukprot:Sro1355_g265560.1 E3 ubiquitin-protein ligase (235) ;mRNA; r:17456-18267